MRENICCSRVVASDCETLTDVVRRWCLEAFRAPPLPRRPQWGCKRARLRQPDEWEHNAVPLVVLAVAPGAGGALHRRQPLRHALVHRPWGGEKTHGGRGSFRVNPIFKKKTLLDSCQRFMGEKLTSVSTFFLFTAGKKKGFKVRAARQ